MLSSNGMGMKTCYALAAALVLVQYEISWAAATSPTCPQTISISETTSQPFPGWEAVANSRLPAPSLINIEIYANHPSKAGALVPDQTSHADQAELSFWNFPPDDETPYWMACVYTDTRLLLVRPIPKQTRQCKLTTALLKQKRNGILSFTCY